MNFYKILIAQQQHSFEDRIKRFIINDPFFQSLFKKYDVPLRSLNKLKIKIKDIGNKNAKSIDNNIFISKDLYNETKNINDLMHIIAHQILHFLHRQRENNCYLSDPQEIEAFTTGIAYQLKTGKSGEEIKEFYLPIFQKHYKNDLQALNLFNKLIQQASLVLQQL